jgi:putative phage-type endonuclease
MERQFLLNPIVPRWEEQENQGEESMIPVNFRSVSGSPDTAEWHAWRLQGIGGSDSMPIAADAGLIKAAPWMDSLTALWETKTGRRGPKAINPAMLRGKNFEEEARQAYERKTGILVSPVFGEMDDARFVRSSFDGMDFAGNLINEIKVPSAKVHGLAKLGQVVDYYKPQLAHQALTAWGHPDAWKPCNEIHFTTYVPETKDIAVVQKSAMEYAAMAEKLFEAERKFWDRVSQDALPCGQEWMVAAMTYQLLDANLESAKAALAPAKAELIRLLGTADKREGAGVMAYRTVREGAVDNKQLLGYLEQAINDLRGELARVCATAGIDPRQCPAYNIEPVSDLAEKFRKPGSESFTVKVAGKKGGEQ